MHWDGTEWTNVPNAGGQFMYGVAGAAWDDVWAVGTEATHNIIMHWNGATWTRVQTPPLQDSTFYGIAVINSNDVWAVGADGYQNRTLTMHWDGVMWSLVPSPNVGARNVLQSVTAIAPDDVWAVGWYADSAEPEQYLALHWDGTEWTNVPVDTEDSSLQGAKILFGVAAASTTEVWAVGQDYDEFHAHVTTAVLRWDGSVWSKVASASPNYYSYLYGLAILGPHIGWAVGSAGPDTYHSGSLVERYGPSCFTPTPGPPTRTPTATSTPGGPSATPHPASPTPCPPGAPRVFTGAITSGDSVQTGRLFRDEPAGTCAQFVSCALMDQTPRHYDSYTLNNPSNSYACVTVEVRADACSSNQQVQSAAYIGSYNPNSLCTNFLADIGTGPNPVKSYSFVVPPQATFVVIVNETNADAGCGGYTVTVTGLPDGACGIQTAVPTTTGTVPRPTDTALPSTETVLPATSTAEATDTPSSGVTETPTEPVPGTSTSVAATSEATSTSEATATEVIAEATATDTPITQECAVQFSDVAQGSTFYPFVHCMTCQGVVGGYSDGTFRPNAQLTRGQLAKIVSSAAGYADAPGGQMFQDVPVGSAFYMYAGRIASRGILSGYPCGGPGEPCGEANLPYFRPDRNATRGQISKIVSNTARLSPTQAGQMFEDVPQSNAFYMYVQALASNGAMGGYPCGGPGEPCGPQVMPYFRPYNNVTRGQAAKIVTSAFYPGCAVSGR
jgi:hypothetical protein